MLDVLSRNDRCIVEKLQMYCLGMTDVLLRNYRPIVQERQTYCRGMTDVLLRNDRTLANICDAGIRNLDKQFASVFKKLDHYKNNHNTIVITITEHI